MQMLVLILNAGFDSKDFRSFCEGQNIFANIDINKRNAKKIDNDLYLNEILYEERFVVERTNAWIDAFKTLLIRFETTIRNWESFHYLAFSLMIIRR